MSNLKGQKEVLKKLGLTVDLMVKGAVEGLMEGGRNVRERGMRVTPVDTSNLINSWYGPIVGKSGRIILVEIGLGASYAPVVHEMVDASFQKPGAMAKFLERPLLEGQAYTRQQVQMKIKQKARI